MKLNLIYRELSLFLNLSKVGSHELCIVTFFSELLEVLVENQSIYSSISLFIHWHNWNFVIYFSVNCLKCWLCKASLDEPKSFEDCNAKKIEKKCPDKPAPACAMFIYKSKTGVLIHAKSCTHQSYCGSNGTFCKDIALGGSDCRLECCAGELCNIKEKFKPTTPPGKTQTTELTTAPTEEPTTVETQTTLTAAPDYDDDDDDCSWTDAGSTHLISGILLLACALCGLLSCNWQPGWHRGLSRKYISASGWFVVVAKIRNNLCF